MHDAPTAAAPLSRRQAREIERATGIRPVAVAPGTNPEPTRRQGAVVGPAAPLTRRELRARERAAAAAAADFRYDTGEIERNEVTALVSVLPAEIADHLAAIGDAPAPIAPVVPIRPDGSPRGASLRAPVPASIAAARRRRTAGGFAAAASAAVVATTGLAALGGDPAAEAQHRASLADAMPSQTLEVPVEDDETAEAVAAAAAPAPEVDADEATTSIERVALDQVLAAGQAVEPEPETAVAGAEGTSSGAASVVAPTGPGTTLSSAYGYRTHPVNGGSAFHEGIDLSGSCGIPLYAVTDGIVTSAGWNGGYGERVDVQGADGTTSFVYAHLQGYAVASGQQVAAGDLIGWLGTTGLSTGCHLHFEVHVGGGSVDPLPWLAERGIHV